MSEHGPGPTWLGKVRSALGLGGGEGDGPNGRHENGRRVPPQTDASRARVSKAAAFDALRVEDVMVPRADIVSIEIDTPLGEAARLFAEAAHSRMPVYRETLDDPVGLVHIKDVLRHIASSPDEGGAPAEARILDAIKRPVLYVPPSMPAADLLLKMQSRRMHMAIVVDEFGGTDGLVTLEDLVEQIVGDISDEHDEAEASPVRPRGVNTWEADARAPVETMEALTQRPLHLPDQIEEVDTLGGLVFQLAGRVPERGEIIRHPAGFEFEVADADPRRIKRLVVRALDAAAPAAAGE